MFNVSAKFRDVGGPVDASLRLRRYRLSEVPLEVFGVVSWGLKTPACHTILFAPFGVRLNTMLVCWCAGVLVWRKSVASAV